LDDDLMTTHFKLAEHAQLIIFRPVASMSRDGRKKFVQAENPPFPITFLMVRPLG
jgi:hypothetical protein